MKAIFAASVATLFATSVSAVDIYKDMGYGNADISPNSHANANIVAVQPSIGDGVDRFQGFGDDNPDVNPAYGAGTETRIKPSGGSSVIYVGPGSEF